MRRCPPLCTAELVRLSLTKTHQQPIKYGATKAFNS